jgi:hypothetical protein
MTWAPPTGDPVRIVVLHWVIADNDIITDIGWDGFELSIAVEHYPDGDVILLMASPDESAVRRWCEREGLYLFDADEYFEYVGGFGWTTRVRP